MEHDIWSKKYLYELIVDTIDEFQQRSFRGPRPELLTRCIRQQILDAVRQPAEYAGTQVEEQQSRIAALLNLAEAFANGKKDEMIEEYNQSHSDEEDLFHAIPTESVHVLAKIIYERLGELYEDIQETLKFSDEFRG